MIIDDPAVTAADQLADILSNALLSGGWRRVEGAQPTFLCRYREPVGPYAVVWTKVVVTLTAAPVVDLDAFTANAWREALARTRWVMPPRGVQGGTLAMPVAIGTLDASTRQWAISRPSLRFATICAPVAVNVATREVVTNPEVPRLGAVLHRRRLSVAGELTAALRGAAAA